VDVGIGAVFLLIEGRNGVGDPLAIRADSWIADILDLEDVVGLKRTAGLRQRRAAGQRNHGQDGQRRQHRPLRHTSAPYSWESSAVSAAPFLLRVARFGPGFFVARGAL